VHYDLPPGGFVAADGAVVLPRRASVALADSEGLEVAFTRVGAPAGVPLYWSQAPRTLSLPPDDDSAKGRVVHVREATHGGEGTIVLAQRQLRADIELSPKSARAGDPIDVRALVWDPSGRVDGANEKVTVQAMLDLDPIGVA
jgi:hypothetical protein